MNVKKEVISKMRFAVQRGFQPTSSTIRAWANSLEQDEQQTPPGPDGLGCSGESSVQPAAIASFLWEEADRIEAVGDDESLMWCQLLYGKADAYREIAEKAKREGWTRTS